MLECAAEHGHLDILQWAIRHGAPWDKLICAAAAMNGHLNVIQWARANGAPWDEHTCWNAVVHSHYDTLQWAFEHGAPWSDEMIKDYEHHIITKFPHIAVSLLRLHRGTTMTNSVARKFIRTLYSIIPLTTPLCDLIIKY